MVRPALAGCNPETLADNAFQAQSAPEGALNTVLAEFDSAVATLRSEGVAVVVIQDSSDPMTPDAIFPNNWFSTESGRVTWYPMMAPSRKAEAKPAVMAELRRRYPDFWDLRDFPPLEGTGSLVLDRINRHAFAALSQRTSLRTLAHWAQTAAYGFTVFETADADGIPVYHTNVMMALGTTWAVVCLDAILDNEDRLAVLEQLEGRDVIKITLSQMASFAGNLIELQGHDGPLIGLSMTAARALEPAQTDRLEQHGRLLPIEIPTIELLGGGSLRCMVAELF